MTEGELAVYLSVIFIFAIGIMIALSKKDDKDDNNDKGGIA